MTLDRKLIAFNSTVQKIIGYRLEELQDMDPRLLAVPEDRWVDIDLQNELIDGKRDSYVMERRYRHKNGRTFWARINYSLVRDLEGKPDYLVGIIEDIDEQKRAAERLAEQEADYLLVLQHRVNERTKELEDANQLLQKEIEQRTKIEQELSLVAGQRLTISFTPHLVPMDRGILSTIYATPLTGCTATELHACYEEFYKGEPFIRILPEGSFPSTAHVRGSNFCDIGITVDCRTRRVVVVSAIDNLVKGASGQAVQNMNILFGLDERMGLSHAALLP